MSEKQKKLCGDPRQPGAWAEIIDWGAFEADCRKDKDTMGSALVYTCVAWAAHKAVRAEDGKPLNHNFQASYDRIRALAVEVMGEHTVKKVETGIKNSVAPGGVKRVDHA